MKPRDLADLLVLAMLWGGSFLFMRITAPAFGPVALIEWRVLIAAVFLLPILAWRGGLGLVARHWRALLVVGVTNSALPFVLFAYATLTITGGMAAVLNSTAPLFGAVVGYLWLRDALRRPQVAGLALGVIGVMTLVWDKLDLASGGVAAVAAGLAASASYGWSANYAKLRLGGVPPLVVATGSQLGAALALAPLAWFFQPAANPPLSAWLCVLALGIACTGLAYILFFRLVANAGSAKAISVTFLVPVFGMLWGALFIGEQVTPTMLAGGVIVLTGTALVSGLIGNAPAAAR